MLEVRNLTKIYKSKAKNGTDTHALDNVTLRFPEKGMVFLLGKSGSGKSTLLNVCGGLDAPTSGEIIVKGRSSKDFTQSDFDSYRNTFVGFIFQEYNILNEFTVEDNIALALELQGKPKDKAVIADLLEQVDLSGFAKRKPNTLSGGQKQRIAIARALVKSPEIIMADEPTGALDSATGKQVFDTLKKLSENKLVIVVSHDREFAELYADRIIELKDGSILSDVTKTQEVQQSISKNVTAIGDILCIKQGSDLTDDDFDRIKNIIKKKNGDVIIAGSDKDVENFKKVNRITSDGEKEVFKDTDESRQESKTYSPEDSKFIRSKLPIKHAVKIGVSGLKTKPVRLFFTIFLCVVSFILFGVLSTLMLYNSEAMFMQTLKDSDHQFVVFDKVYYIENSYFENGELMHSYEDLGTAKFGEGDIKKISEEFGAGAFGAIGIYAQINVRQSSTAYWMNDLRNAAFMPENSFARQNLVKGKYPTKDNEIYISSYIANMLVECKAVDEDGSLVNLDEYTDIVGKEIVIDGTPYKVTGIFDSGEIDARFEALKEGTNNDYSLQNDFESMMNDGTQLLIGLSEEGLEKFESRYGNMYDHYGNDYYNRRADTFVVNDNYSNDMYEGDSSSMRGSTVYYQSLSKLNSSDYVSITGSKITSLKDNEVIIPFNLLSNNIYNEIYEQRNSLSQIKDVLEGVKSQLDWYKSEIAVIEQNLQRIEEIEEELLTVEEYSDEYDNLVREKEYLESSNYDERLAEYQEGRANYLSNISSEYNISINSDIDSQIASYNSEIEKLEALSESIDIIRNGEYYTTNSDGESVVTTYSVSERKALLEQLISDYPDFVKNKKLGFALTSGYSDTLLTEREIYNIVGIVVPTGTFDFYVEDIVYLNDNTSTEYWDIQKANLSYSESITKYKNEDGAIFTKLYIPYDHSDSQTRYLWDIYSNEEFAEDDSRFGLCGSHIDSLQMIDSFVTELSTIFFYVGLVLALFAILLFSNFISVSISQKKREIGILRAVGARSLDVFKIFFSESLVIAAICSVLSIAGSSILCGVLNTELGSALGASIFVFGVASVLIIFAIALLTAFLATFLPVWNAAKKKPVDSIRAI